MGEKRTRSGLSRGFAMARAGSTKSIWVWLHSHPAKFKYLGSIIDRAGGCYSDVQKRINNGWGKWKSLTGVMCDKKMPDRLKGKVYKTVIRPVMMYGSETWTLRKEEERMLEAAEMKMLRWSTGKTKLDKVKNEDTRAKMRVRKIEEKLLGQRMRWYGHVQRRDEDYVGKAAANITLKGGRKRGRPAKRWIDNVNGDMRFLQITPEDAMGRDLWSKLTCMADPRT